MEVSLSITSKNVTRILVVIVSFLIVASLASQYAVHYLDTFPLRVPLKHLFSVGSENNLPTWYSSFALLLASGLSGLIARAKKSTADPYALHWHALMIVMLCLSIDETASLHERLGNMLYRQFPTHGYLYYIWVIPGMAFVLAFVLGNLKFLMHLPAKTRFQFLAGGAIFISGALGFEMIVASYEDLYDSMGIVILTTIEESCEMFGIVIFIHALLLYIKSSFKDIHIRFGN